MSAIEDTVDAIEAKIHNMLHKFEILKQQNKNLQEQINQYHQKIQAQHSEIKDWEAQYKALKVANSILGSDNNKRETKLKINALIREIDYCIVQLSE